jgi:hypothetical protein
MSDWRAAVQDGIKTLFGAWDPARYMAAGLPVTCSHCKHDIFERGLVPNLGGGSGVALTMNALTCTQCGQTLLFSKPVMEIAPASETAPADTTNAGSAPAG